MEDSKILLLYKTKQKEALELIFDKYYEYLVKEVYFILRDKGETEDVVQELFLELWKKQVLINNISSSLKHYLKRAAVNRALNKIKQRRDFEHESVYFEKYRSVIQPNLTEINDLDKEIKKSIDKLPLRCRTIFILSRYEDKTYKEIAVDLEISVKTVENQIGKALKILRNKLVLSRGGEY